MFHATQGLEPHLIQKLREGPRFQAGNIVRITQLFYPLPMGVHYSTVLLEAEIPHIFKAFLSAQFSI
jgi:hypothetical protein